jgi:hypothetical protein
MGFFADARTEAARENHSFHVDAIYRFAADGFLSSIVP